MNINIDVAGLNEPIDFNFVFIDEDVYGEWAVQTNLYAQQVLAKQCERTRVLSPSARMNRWKFNPLDPRSAEVGRGRPRSAEVGRGRPRSAGRHSAVTPQVGLSRLWH